MRNIKELTIVFASVEYADNSGSKARPVFILYSSGKLYKALKITSKFENKSKAIQKKYFEIIEWQKAGLWKKSWIDTVKGYDLPEGSVIRELGKLTLSDTRRLFDFIKERFDLFE